MPEPWEEAIKEIKAKILDIERDLAGAKNNSAETVALKEQLTKLQGDLLGMVQDHSKKGKSKDEPPVEKDPLAELIGG